MSQQTHTVSDTNENKDSVLKVASTDDQDCNNNDSEDGFPKLSRVPRPRYGGTTWNKDDRGYENIRRPAMRKNKVPMAPASLARVIETMERELQEKEDARRSVLEGEFPDDQIDAMLKTEFGEYWKELQQRKDALK